MKITIVRDYGELSRAAAGVIIDLVKRKPNAVLGLATGATPLGMYQELVTAYRQGLVSFSQVSTFNLDDYVGLGRDSQHSFYNYMYKNFFSQVDIRQENIFLLDGTADNVDDECANYQRLIEETGGIDLQVLGIGMDGHIGFCEPGTSFESWTLRVALTQQTRESGAAEGWDLQSVPAEGLTMGPATIMAARKTMLLASGRHKAYIVNRALYGEVEEAVPASILQRHPDCLVYLDAAAAGQ